MLTSRLLTEDREIGQKKSVVVWAHSILQVLYIWFPCFQLVSFLYLTVDNKSRQVIQGRKGPVDLSFFTEEQQKPKVSPQLQLAILQYLTTGGKFKWFNMILFKPWVTGGLLPLKRPLIAVCVTSEWVLVFGFCLTGPFLGTAAFYSLLTENVIETLVFSNVHTVLLTYLKCRCRY